ncbi:hypothetical protein Hanom_Chr03g00256261 [Helianthus anomalus]
MLQLHRSKFDLFPQVCLFHPSLALNHLQQPPAFFPVPRACLTGQRFFLHTP